MELEYTQLASAIARVFAARGACPEDAQGLGRELADATFAGYESHGIGRVGPYVRFIEQGLLDPRGSLTTVQERGAVVTLDGGQGFGILRGLEAADQVVARTRSHGLCAATLRNAGDVARLAPYAERIAQAGFIGLVMANDAGAGMIVAPHGGTEPLLSTNPLAAGLPRPGQRPIVFDLATSQIALGAARAAQRRGQPLDHLSMIGPDGAGVHEPGALFEGLAALLPLGGMVFGFKGTALGLLVEVLAGGLSGDGCSGDHPERRGRNAVFLLGLDPSAFGPIEAFHSRLDRFLDRMRRNRPRPGVPAVRVPGEHGPAPGPGQSMAVLDSLWEELLHLA